MMLSPWSTIAEPFLHVLSPRSGTPPAIAEGRTQAGPRARKTTLAMQGHPLYLTAWTLAYLVPVTTSVALQGSKDDGQDAGPVVRH